MYFNGDNENQVLESGQFLVAGKYLI